MATFDDLKAATDALAAAKSDLASAESALFSKNAEVFALIATEEAAHAAASAVLDAAIVSARSTVGWDPVNSDYQAASASASSALQTLIETMAAYDGL
jgi:hypothetical protein